MTEEYPWLSPQPHSCHIDWGRRGTVAAARRRDAVVIVDVLSFSTCVATAVANRGEIVPCAPADDAASLATTHRAVIASKRGRASSASGFSLSPKSFAAMAPGTRVVLPSPNGSACSRLAGEAPLVLAGALVNASAVAERLGDYLAHHPRAGITVVACGERWPSAPAVAIGTDSEEGPGTLRVALEDYLGAGAIIAALAANLDDLVETADAQAARVLFEGVRERVSQLVHECPSGRELVARGCVADVEHAAMIDRYRAVPVLYDGVWRCEPPSGESER